MPAREPRSGCARAGALPVAAAVALLACSSARDGGDAAAQVAPSPSLDGRNGAALCGGADEACCAEPLPACSGTLQCEAGRCSPASSPSHAALCKTSGECSPNETCCPAGVFGICVAVAAAEACPRPDLALHVTAESVFAGGSFYTEFVEPGACDARCVRATGPRRMLALGPTIFNLGAIDAVLGTPLASSGLCSPAVPGMLRYELVADGGRVVVEADALASPNCGYDSLPGPNFNCQFLGLESRTNAGFLELPAACPDLDVSGIPPGSYRLRASIDPDGRVPDQHPDNNVFEMPIVIPAEQDLSVPCNLDSDDRVDGLERDCGWTPSAMRVCAPGEAVRLGCPDCTGNPVLRVCEASAQCTLVDALAFGINNTVARSGRCPVAAFPCPAIGAYTAYVAPFTSVGAFSCQLEELP